MSSNSSTIRNTAQHPSMFNLAALALILLMGGLGIAYLLDAYAKPAPLPSVSVFEGPFVGKSLAGAPLNIPAEWQNPTTRTNTQQVSFLDLQLRMKFQADAPLTHLKIRLSPIENSEPSSTVLDSVYTLRFTQKQLSEFGGLIGKPLKPEEGFENETVWYDPISTTPFVAKCIDLGMLISTANCLRTVQISPRLAATYQFSSDQLPYWREFDAMMIQIFDKILQPITN